MQLLNVLALVGATWASSDRLVRSTNSTGSLPSVTLDYTTLLAAAGNTTAGLYKFQNIRFAQAPIGDLRFAPPQWPLTETEINTGNLADADVACDEAEDCLFMDIFVPEGFTGQKLPVIVWTYGGGFTGGSKSENSPEGLFDLSKDFIYVAYNYRLGMAGLANGVTLQHQGGTSNVAVWDVEHALKWTKKYISNFGGDSDAITAVGFSAGASQVMFQLTRFAGHAEQTFAQAYIMSPGYVPGAGHQHSEAFWQNVSSAVGCTGGDLTCMRAVNFTTLQDTADTVVSNYTYQFQPRVDGDIIADTYESQLYQKRFNFSGPCVITHELHEANSQEPDGINTAADVADEIRAFFPAVADDVVDELLSLYPESDYTSSGYRWSDMKQSLDLTAKNLALTQALDNQTWNGRVEIGSATHGTDQSYYFYNTWTLSTSATKTSSGPNSTVASLRKRQMGGNSTPVNATLAVTMQKYLVSFVLTGNPNTLWPADKLEWPAYNTTEAGATIIFNQTITVGTDDLLSAKSLFWNKALWY